MRRRNGEKEPIENEEMKIRAQLEQLHDNYKTNQEALFSIVVGFFYTEFRIANYGFNIIPQSELDVMRKSSLPSISMTFQNFVARLVKMIDLFSEKMAGLSLNALLLQTFLDQRLPRFRKKMFKNASTSI